MNAVIDELIRSIHINKSNLDYISANQHINGTLYMEIKRIMEIREQEFKDQISDINTKHQEELGNYNSYAAGEMANRYDEQISVLVTKYQRDIELHDAMMGEISSPVKIVLTGVISDLKNFNID